MKLIYIAGPYTADNVELKYENISRAEKLGYYYLYKGYSVIIPHKNYKDFEIISKRFSENKALKTKDFLLADFEILSRCDEMIVLPRSENSKGTIAEIAIANSFGIKITQLTVLEYDEKMIEIGFKKINTNNTQLDSSYVKTESGVESGRLLET